MGAFLRLDLLFTALQRVLHMGEIAAELQMMHDFQQLFLIRFVKPSNQRAVDIQHADHATRMMQGNDDFGI